MLETEEVDDDFFTPVAGTSLANIFGNASNNKESTQNDSLKYVPPKPQNIVPKKKEQTKNSECVCAYTVTGHEWYNNVYISRGRVGMAIMKILKTGEHSIVLYDSNKTTLSNVVVSPKLEITIKNNTYICYYDNQQKYWSLYGSEETIKNIVEALKSCGANINNSTYTDEGPPEPNEAEKHISSDVKEQQNIESDTDSSVNKKTKASILNRMANMGHSVLPTRAPPAEISSDSSETVENVKTARHKPVKTTLKRNTPSVDNIVSENQKLNTDHLKTNIASTEPEKHVAVYSSQIIPFANTSVMPGTSNEFGMYMSEQRVSNSEMRINMNRITDKMDLVLNKLNSLEHKEKDTNVSTDIMLKLLTEYEIKIKVYEEMLKSTKNNGNISTCEQSTHTNKDSEDQILKAKITEIEKDNQEKCNEISSLKEEIGLLKDKHYKECHIQDSKINELNKKINTLEADLTNKNGEISGLKIASNTENSNSNIEEKVKNIMNDTFQTISMNFDNSENYSGETIKRIIGRVIKKITIQTLSEL